MVLERTPLAQDYKYTLEYDDVVVEGKKFKRIKKMTSTGTFPMNTCVLNFEYNPDNTIKKLYFERPFNPAHLSP
jgi:hypothetical protein